MKRNNYYDVTDWQVGNPYTDIGEVINSIIADIKNRQKDTNVNDGGKPGAVIYIPSGDYHLKTQVKIDISYLKIQGSGHGFVSSSIRYNVPKEQWKDLHDIWPGGSRILVDLEPLKGDERSGAAFLVEREGDPRISSVEFENFCIDGLHFVDEGNGDPENTYLNGKTGIEISCIPRNLIIVIFYYQISLKPLKTLSLSQVSFPLLFPLYYIVPPVFTNSDKGKYKGKKIL